MDFFSPITSTYSLCFLQVIVVPAYVNAGTLALIDAGIPMKDFVCACSATYLDDTDAR